MNKIFTTIIFLMLLAIPSQVSAASITPLISYQGRLLDSANSPVSNTVAMTFKLYDAQTGGVPLWSETKNVLVTNGIFNTYLGDTTSLTVPQFNNATWLEMVVGGETLTPRQQLSGSPYAFSLAPGAVISNSTHDHDSRYAKSNQSCIVGKVVTGVDAGGNLICNNSSTSASLEARILELERILNGVNRTGNDIYFNGTNVHITSGSGYTHGDVNGLGNLIIGYNEARWYGGNRTGSHNLILGEYNNYRSYGGLAAGSWNEISGPFASISGGDYNMARGESSSVSGGYGNIASGIRSTVNGGEYNTASGDASSVSGGSSIKTTESTEWATGSINSSGSDVYFNRTNVHITSGSGTTDGNVNGLGNLIIGYNEPRTYYLDINDRTGSHNLVLGSGNNYGSYGGLVNGYMNQISGPYASVGGGNRNIASGLYSSVSGGNGNTASGLYSSVSGGIINKADGESSSVSGGRDNTASGYASSVSGGEKNMASGWSSSVSGGYDGIVPGDYDWMAGTYFQQD